MATISIYRTEILRFTLDGSRRNRHKFRRTNASWRMAVDSKSSQKSTKEELSVQLSKHSIPNVEKLKQPDLRFDRLQPPAEEVEQGKRVEFGRFVAREAVLDEEYWTAAWLRAESHWEGRTSERYVDNFKRKFAEQEFNTIKRRCRGLNGQKCMCIVAVKKEERNVKRTILKSVVGTLDLSIRYMLQGEHFPGERLKHPILCSISSRRSNRYGYIANLCVAKSARRQGIARNMLLFAVESARSNGLEQLYVHVHKNNNAAQELYQRMGFEVVEMAQPELIEEETYLLRLKT